MIEIQNLEGEMVGENTFPLLKVFGKVNIVLLLWYISYSSTKFEDGYLMPTSKIKLVPKLRLNLFMVLQSNPVTLNDLPANKSTAHNPRLLHASAPPTTSYGMLIHGFCSITHYLVLVGQSNY